MNFFELHFMGGIEFMSVLSLCLLSILALTFLQFRSKTPMEKQPYWFKKGIKQAGLFALFFGLFGQIIGLMGAFKAIEMAGEVSQGLMAGGLYVSTITTAYGFVIFLLSLLLDYVIKSIKA